MRYRNWFLFPAFPAYNKCNYCKYNNYTAISMCIVENVGDITKLKEQIENNSLSLRGCL